MLRSHTLGELTKTNIGNKVVLAGWVHRRRDHGGLLFIDLRDRYGITQVVVHPEQAESFRMAEQVRPEWVLGITGQVRARPKGTVNPELPTGEVEVLATGVEIFSEARTPPFEIDSEENVNEELRLEYRYLDVRRTGLRKRLELRHAVVRSIRDYMSERGFLEIETPLLTSSSPEGARDYLVPSRIHPGKFYALPQAPQQFKQLLMIGGIDRYFQIARALRDEGLRGDRQPEHTQLDVEMSFVEQDDVFKIIEPLYKRLVKEHTSKKLARQAFPRYTYQEAMDRYGTDKPDLRFGLELHDVTEIVKKSDFKVFTSAEQVKCIDVPDFAGASRRELDELIAYAQEEGGKGLGWAKVGASGEFEDSPVTKFLSADIQAELRRSLKTNPGDVLLFSADKPAVVAKVLGATRRRLGEQLKLADPQVMAFAWIVDFPMYEFDDERGAWDFAHNPFSMPQGGLDALKDSPPEAIKAYQYDLVCNGYELASGAIRNHRPEIMRQAFHKVGYTDEHFDKAFGHFMKAFEYGAPPHGGIAPGVDRLLMLLADQPNIREVMAFPKTQKGEDLMMRAPSEVDDKQLRELHIMRKKP